MRAAVSARYVCNVYQTRPDLTSVNIARPDSYSIDTTNVLFILSGAFVGLEKIIKQRISKGVSSHWTHNKLT